MVQSFKFSVLQAIPDRRRGERVNIGMVVFLADRLDIRLPESRKLSALTGKPGDSLAHAYVEQISSRFDVKMDAAHLISSPYFSSQVFELSEPGVMTVRAGDDYEKRVKSILDVLVLKPKTEKIDKQAKINAEIRQVLKKAEVLAKRNETIDDHKVVQKFIVSKEKDAVADFAYKNGALKVVSTLDLRGDKSLHGRACEKGATLYFAREVFGKSVRTFGVYAAHPLEVDAHRSEIEIMKSFAGGHAFNWLDPNQRQQFQHALY